MKTGSVVLLAGVGFAIYYFAGLGVAGNDLLVVFKGFQFNNISNITITFTLQNVSNSKIIFNSLAATVYLNGDTLGNISGFQQVEIPANSQQDLPLTFNVSLLSLPSIATDLMNNLGGNYTLRVKGNFNANNIPLPLDVSEVINF